MSCKPIRVVPPPEIELQFRVRFHGRCVLFTEHGFFYVTHENATIFEDPISANSAIEDCKLWGAVIERVGKYEKVVIL